LPSQILVPATKYEYFPQCAIQCTENPIYVFPETELRILSPNSYIHVSVSDLYIPRIGPHILLQQNRQTGPGNIYKSLKDI
jgi:hypothetical protein